MDEAMDKWITGNYGEDQFKEDGEDDWRCVLCGGLNSGFGNNPQPLAKEGRCCDGCNIMEVIPRRILDAKNEVSER